MSPGRLGIAAKLEVGFSSELVARSYSQEAFLCLGLMRERLMCLYLSLALSAKLSNLYPFPIMCVCVCVCARAVIRCA